MRTKAKTIDMQFMRYINLFERICRVRTKNCFTYNNTVFFAIPSHLISRALGDAGKNIRELSKVIGKRVKIIPLPYGKRGIENFILSIIAPVKFKGVEIKNDEIIISGGNRQNKATLIGRNKTRLQELEEIVKAYFGKDLKVV